MRISDNGLNLIKKFEGCKLTAYRDAVGVATLGWGHTTAAGLPIVKDGMTITAQEASDILRSDVAKFEDAVNRVLHHEPTQNQFDAMVSLCYNIGPGNFGASTVLADFNANDMTGAGLAFTRWCKAGGQTLPGLVARRQTEMALFNTPDAHTAPIPVPSHMDSPTPAKPAASPFLGLVDAILYVLSILFTRKATK